MINSRAVILSIVGKLVRYYHGILHQYLDSRFIVKIIGNFMTVTTVQHLANNKSTIINENGLLENLWSPISNLENLPNRIEKIQFNFSR